MTDKKINKIIHEILITWTHYYLNLLHILHYNLVNNINSFLLDLIIGYLFFLILMKIYNYILFLIFMIIFYLTCPSIYLQSFYNSTKFKISSFYSSEIDSSFIIFFAYSNYCSVINIFRLFFRTILFFFFRNYI